MDANKFTMIDWIAIIGGISGLFGGIAGVMGAIISGVAAYIAWLAFRRDKADVKLSIEKNRELIGPAVDIHGYKRNVSYTCLSVTNKGRRPVTIDGAGANYLKNSGGFIFSESLVYGSRELKEGKRIDYMTEQDGLDFGNISSFYARDSVGNTYIKNYAPWYNRFCYSFLDKTRIRKKPSPLSKKNK